MSEMIRAFIAIELPADLKGMLQQVAQQLEQHVPAATVRWVRPAAMHLTLVFLGDTSAAKLNSISQAIEAAAAPISPITFAAARLGCFPNTRQPRVVWVGIDEPAGLLPALKAALDRELEPLGFRPEKRPFSPHLTLGRVNKRASHADAAKLGQVVAGATLDEVGRVTATQVHLIRSDLRPAGPTYTTLASAQLGTGLL